MFDLITGGMQTVFLTVDDTLLPRFGLKIFGAGVHRDPVLSCRVHAVIPSRAGGIVEREQDHSRWVRSIATSGGSKDGGG